MNRIVLGVVFFVLAGAVGIRAQDATGPKMVVAELQHDFGTIVQGTKVEYVFEIRNAGTGQLVLERVLPS